VDRHGHGHGHGHRRRASRRPGLRDQGRAL